ncbi:MAG TPA: biopolymer transporter ExbD, partial [Myxococcaceae bacterium]|nr:biopolymer transporter ExbD [Myxococcaceae bacterium]
MAPPGNKPIEISEDDVMRMRFRSAMQRKKRRERDAAFEIRELNITAMMDMMTIILVFLLKSYSTSSVAMTASEDLKPPISSTRATPKDTVALTVTPKAILVGERKVLDLVGGRIPPNALAGNLVTPLDAALKKEVDKLKNIADRNPSAPFTHE